MSLADAGKTLGLEVVKVAQKKAGDLWHSLTDQQKDDVSAILVACGEDSVLSMAGDEEAKTRLAVNLNSLNDYKLKSGITAARLGIEALEEVLKEGLKIAIAIIVAVPK
jgi:hypothetical protein